MIEKESKILYLDQFASSNLALKNTGIWSELKLLLKQCILNEKIICPIPHSHYIETPQANKKQALIIDSYFSELSCGYYFKTSAITTSQLIISFLRGNNITLNTYISRGIKENALTEEETLEFYENKKVDFSKMINEATVVANHIRTITHGQKIEKESKIIMYEAFAKLSVKGFIERLNDLVKKGNITIRGDKFSFIEVPNWIDQTIYRLLKVHKMNFKETKKLVSTLNRYGFSEFPTLNIRTLLYAIISIENKKEYAGDHIDIERIATGLPISDYFFTDKQRKSEIITLGLNTKYNSKVYSGSIDDLNNFKNELIKLITNQ